MSVSLCDFAMFFYVRIDCKKKLANSDLKSETDGSGMDLTCLINCSPRKNLGT